MMFTKNIKKKTMRIPSIVGYRALIVELLFLLSNNRPMAYFKG